MLSCYMENQCHVNQIKDMYKYIVYLSSKQYLVHSNTSSVQTNTNFANTAAELKKPSGSALIIIYIDMTNFCWA